MIIDNKSYLSTITVTDISQSFTYKMAAKTNWNKGTKLRHYHSMYNLTQFRLNFWRLANFDPR